MELVAIGDEARVRDALRLVLSGRVEDVEIFDRAFDDFFFPARSGIPQEGLPDLGPSLRDSVKARRPPSALRDDHAADGREDDAESNAATATPAEGGDDGRRACQPGPPRTCKRLSSGRRAADARPTGT